jgi:hypothetical protein
MLQCLAHANAASAFCNPVLGRWHISSWCHYIFLCIGITVLVRAVQSLFKAWAFTHDDVPNKQRVTEKAYWPVWWKNFLGFRFGRNNDLWLPTLVGLAELIAYPILIVTGQGLIIGGWLGLKTAGAWGGWKTSGTAYNRFLLFNLVNLFVAYLWLAHFVQYVPCP